MAHEHYKTGNTNYKTEDQDYNIGASYSDICDPTSITPPPSSLSESQICLKVTNSGAEHCMSTGLCTISERLMSLHYSQYQNINLKSATCPTYQDKIVLCPILTNTPHDASEPARNEKQEECNRIKNKEMEMPAELDIDGQVPYFLAFCCMP